VLYVVAAATEQALTCGDDNFKGMSGFAVIMPKGKFVYV
jgi:hypothetical protein